MKNDSLFAQIEANLWGWGDSGFDQLVGLNRNKGISFVAHYKKKISYSSC